MATPLDFARALLNRLGLAQTQNRLVSIVAFAAEEGGHWGNPASRYNPLNTTRSVPGSHKWSGPGNIQVFPDWSSGIEATALTIGQPNMRPILDALKADAAPVTFLHAITATPWCPQSEPSCADYALRDPYVLYKSYAHKEDTGSMLAISGSSGPPWGLIAGAAIAVGILGAGVFYYEKGRLPFMRRRYA